MQAEAKRATEATAGTTASVGKIGTGLKCIPQPAFIAERIKLFEAVYARNQEEYKTLPHAPIKITLPDGNTKDGVSFQTTPYDIAKAISPGLANKAVAAKIKYTKKVGTVDEGVTSAEFEKEKREAATQKTEDVYDLHRPLEGDCELKILTFADPEGKVVFWHSGAHVLGQALENLYGCYLTHGPPLEVGFFYDSYAGDLSLSQERYEEINQEAAKILKARQPFLRAVMTKEEALQLFQANPFKMQLIMTKVPDKAKTTVYRCGNLIDLCTGPHIPNTSMIEAFLVTKSSGSYWLGEQTSDALQRVYGVAYPTKKEMTEYKKTVEEAAKRDHRNIGKQQELFFFNDISPGSCFYFPDGAFVYNRLIGFMREELRLRGYTEVLAPNIFNLKLWKISGHYKNYKEHMFILPVEKQGFGMKPMNCPGHCMIYLEKLWSYKDFPIRMSEFGVLHRNEFSGSLAGLFRVRRFVQDDAHIFARADQIEQEVMGCLDLAKYIYASVFNFDYELVLATRPPKFLGKIEVWDQAEAALKNVLQKLGAPWRLNPGDGAFYGPKIDILIKDALGRGHQIGTVQLDFQLPIRFNLQYRTDEVVKDSGKGELVPARPDLLREEYPPDEYDAEKFVWEERELKPGFVRPVMIHRAILGSIERFLGTLVENCMGKFPFWLSPRQVCVITVSDKFAQYAELVTQRLKHEGFAATFDSSSTTLKKKVRNMQLENYNYAAVIGESEMANEMVDVRTLTGERLGKIRIQGFINFLHSQNKPPISNVRKHIMETMWLSKEERAQLGTPAVPKFEFLKSQEPDENAKDEPEDKRPPPPAAAPAPTPTPAPEAKKQAEERLNRFFTIPTL